MFSLDLVEMKRSIDKIKLMFWNRLCTTSYSLFYKKLFIARLCSFGSATPRPKRGFLADIYSIMSEYSIDIFFLKYLLNRDVPPKYTWKQFVGTVVDTAADVSEGRI